MDWASYTASPTISVYHQNSILWVALYAVSDDADPLQIFLIGHHYQIEDQDTSTLHRTIGKDKVLPLFQRYIANSNTDTITQALQQLDSTFEQSIGPVQ